MKIGIIGLGSIGRKHAKILDGLGKEVYALRSKKGQLKSLTDEFSFVHELFDLNDFLALPLDGIIISSPSSLHIPNLLDVLSMNIPILVEKPLAGHLEQVEKVPETAKPLIKTAYCLRFHPLTQMVKKWIVEGQLGKPLKANVVVGQYLPTWHEYADYRKEYYAIKKLGGGALKTLSHELDLALFWFGKFTQLAASVKKISNLEIDVDDNAFLINEHSSGVVSNISIDFLAPVVKRKGTISFEKGELQYDYINKKLAINFYEGNKIESQTVPDKDFYLDQMLDFIQFIANRESQNSSFDEGVHLMDVIDKAEQFSLSNRWINLK